MSTASKSNPIPAKGVGIPEPIEREGHPDPTSESIGPFTNHLAIAVERISKGEPITDINEQVNEVVRDHPD